MHCSVLGLWGEFNPITVWFLAKHGVSKHSMHDVTGCVTVFQDVLWFALILDETVKLFIPVKILYYAKLMFRNELQGGLSNVVKICFKLCIMQGYSDYKMLTFVVLKLEYSR